MAENIQPLRIQKGTPLASPSKMSLPKQRPLAELSPMEKRRNSPSYNQATKKSLFNGESSPFDSPPFIANSPRQYWQTRDSVSPTRFGTENSNQLGTRDASPSPVKRSSLENLKRASRVKNSNMFAREQKNEYDPTSSPMIERPLATGRPLSTQIQGNAYGGRGMDGLRKHKQQDGTNQSVSPLKSPGAFDDAPYMASSPTKGQLSPGKSSLSKKSRYALAQGFDPENGIWSDEEDSSVERQLPPGKGLHRHAKSVTFDAAPPQINEYEMTTPDPSSIASGSREGSYDSVGDEEESFDRGSSIERDDSFDASLEDTEKTPVVLPEDWRFMSPTNANETLAAHVEDPFDGEQSSPAPTSRPSTAIDARSSPTRTDSTASNGDRRPLPPLPGLDLPSFPRARSDSNGSLSATAERLSSVQRDLPVLPRPASVSKAEIQGMGGCSLSLEDRLRLMMLQDEQQPKSPEEEQRERRLRRGQSKSPEREITVQETEISATNSQNDADDVAGLGEFKLPARISRESILRKVKAQRQEPDYEGLEYDSPSLSPMAEEHSLDNIDPDVALPSLESDQTMEDAEASIVIKEEDSDEIDVDLYSIPDLYSQQLHAESYMNAIEKLEEYAERTNQGVDRTDDDDASQYSTESKDGHYQQDKQAQSVTDEDSLPTPRARTPIQVEDKNDKSTHRMSLPQFASMLGNQDFGFGLESFMTPSPPMNAEPTKIAPSSDEQRVEVIHETAKRPITPDAQLQPPKFPGYGAADEEAPGTPDSVIRHSIADSPDPPSPAVPERVATIKAPGGKLKTRPSITPADVEAMAETRRQVSREVPAVSALPDRHYDHPSMIEEASFIEPETSGQKQSLGSYPGNDATSTAGAEDKRASSLVKLDLAVESSGGLGFGLDQEFDRVIEAQKKGYLMRQNTKVVVASSASHESVPDTTSGQDPTARGTRSAGNSPRKPSQTRTWTTEPWNGKVRRKSIRQSGGATQKILTSGPVPPLPGQQSNVTSGLHSVDEDETVVPEEIEDGAERGRLFVKVLRVKDLELPLPRGERSYFALTLDNGLHCVTTAWLELGKTAPIGQEFELVVLNDLEFQLTLQTKIEEPKAKPIVESPTKAPVSPKKSAFSKVFASPRKRKEIEVREQEEARKADRQRQQEAQANRRSTQPTAWDLLHNLVAKDGSFGRSYVCLKDHESSAFGRPYTVDVPCFNEWAMEEAQNPSSVKSKRSTISMGMQRKAPYRIGKLELQLFYVPKPKDAKDDDMPKSMNACIRELKEAESSSTKKWEGHLSQQGGDCPFWRRRFFTLEGSKFTAYHEATRQPRATINLSKASKLIDDKSSLMQKEASSKSGGRRKSAFAEEEEGYMFVEEGFRIRFANGETIDFYADSAAAKDDWMKVLSEVVGMDLSKPKSWTDIIMAKQRAAASRPARADPQSLTKAPQASPTKAAPTRSAPPTPAKPAPSKTFVPAPVAKDAKHVAPTGQRRPDAAAKTRSMIF
ncbi:Bud site selection protein bud4 [Xanthoria parietina]